MSSKLKRCRRLAQHGYPTPLILKQKMMRNRVVTTWLRPQLVEVDYKDSMAVQSNKSRTGIVISPAGVLLWLTAWSWVAAGQLPLLRCMTKSAQLTQAMFMSLHHKKSHCCSCPTLSIPVQTSTSNSCHNPDSSKQVN